jgi:hypothetical protein
MAEPEKTEKTGKLTIWSFLTSIPVALLFLGAGYSFYMNGYDEIIGQNSYDLFDGYFYDLKITPESSWCGRFGCRIGDHTIFSDNTEVNFYIKNPSHMRINNIEVLYKIWNINVSSWASGTYHFPKELQEEGVVQFIRDDWKPEEDYSTAHENTTNIYYYGQRIPIEILNRENNSLVYVVSITIRQKTSGKEVQESFMVIRQALDGD